VGGRTERPAAAPGPRDKGAPARRDHNTFDRGRRDHNTFDRGRRDHDTFDRGRRDHDTFDRGRRDHDTFDRGRRDHDTFDRGRGGEAIAAHILQTEGWSILERNYRGPRGEIDIIARQGDTIAFVEVKNWSAYDISELGVAISAGKARRIVETSKIFLFRNREYSSARVRYDVLLIREGRVARRIESAFTGET